MKPVEGMELSASLGFSKPIFEFLSAADNSYSSIALPICLAAKGVVCGVVLCGF
jgi:hypothetical protein